MTCDDFPAISADTISIPCEPRRTHTAEARMDHEKWDHLAVDEVLPTATRNAFIQDTIMDSLAVHKFVSEAFFFP